MKRGDEIKLFFDEEGETCKIMLLEPVKAIIPMEFLNKEEAQNWARNFLLPAIDEVMKRYAPGQDVSFGTIARESLLLIMKADKEKNSGGTKATPA